MDNMELFRKKCTFCGIKIKKGQEVIEDVKVPEWQTLLAKPFCNKRHACEYIKEITGTPRRNFCPSCPV